jgi:hypothetical protein
MVLPTFVIQAHSVQSSAQIIVTLLLLLTLVLIEVFGTNESGERQPIFYYLFPIVGVLLIAVIGFVVLRVT